MILHESGSDNFIFMPVCFTIFLFSHLLKSNMLHVFLSFRQSQTLHPFLPQGDFGEKGVKGFIGDIGPKGITGLKGDVGPKGEAGFKGEKGGKGSRGFPSLNGNKGSKGLEDVQRVCERTRQGKNEGEKTRSKDCLCHLGMSCCCQRKSA